jgi:hypothetical protein
MTLISPIPNGPFYSAPSNYINSPQGFLVVGSGLSVASDGTLLVASATGGTVSQVTAGVGLSGGNITSTGIISLVPATNASLGGVKIGANLAVSPDGTLSALPPGIGTITGVFGSGGITGGGTSGSVTLSLQAASSTQFGGVQVGAGLNAVSGLISLVPASTTAVGGVQLATASEVIAGANPAKAVTPATLAAKTASTLAPGIVQLSDNASLTSSTLAATPTAVKTAYTAAQAAQVTATAALPKAGGIMTGVIVFSPAQTFPGVSFPVATTNSLGVVSVGPGLSVNSSGVLSTSNVGTVTAVTAGPGLGSPASGNTISTSGTIRLLPPTTDGLQLGGVKQGANVAIAFDGTISVPGSNFIASNNPFPFNGYVWPAALGAPSLPFPGVNGQVLTVLDNSAGTIGWTNAGTLQSVVAGAGLTVTSTPTTATVSLTTVSSITPGSFGATAIIPTFSVNAQGQIISTGSANPYPPFQIATVTAPPNLVLDFSTNMTNWEYTLNGSLTLSNPINALPGMRGGMLLRQNPTTPFALTWGSSWKFANFTPASISNIAAAVDYFEFVVVASNYIIVTAYLNGVG